jgi:large subunit ribosomal protein L10
MAKKESLGRACKERMIEELVQRIKDRPNFVITNHFGSSVADLEQLRRNLRKSSASYIVVKNSILKIIFDDLKLKDDALVIEGIMGLSLTGEDVVTICKTLVTFAKDHDKFKIKSAYFFGKAIGQDKIKQLASLPPKEILLAQVVGGIKAPISGFVNTLGGILRKFVYVVDAIKTSRQNEPQAAAQEAAKT